MADIIPSIVGGALGRMVGSALDSTPSQGGLPVAPAREEVQQITMPESPEAARQDYYKEMNNLRRVQADLLRSLEERSKPNASDTLFAISRGLLAPNPTGQFGVAFGNAAGELQGQQEKQNAAAQQLAKMRLEMVQSGVGMAEKGIALAQEQQRVNALRGLRGGAPGVAGSSVNPQAIQSAASSVGLSIPNEAWSLIEGMDSKQAIETLTKFMLKNAETPDAVKAVNAFANMLPKGDRAAAMESRARSEMFGKPEDILKAIVDVRTAVRQGVMSAQEGEAQIANLNRRLNPVGASGTSAPNEIIPSKISGTPQEVMDRLMRIPDPAVRREAIESYIKQLETSGPLNASATAPVAPAAPSAAASAISPQQQSELEMERQKAIVQSQIADRNQLRAASREANKNISTANAVFDIVSKQPGGFGLFNQPTVSAAIGTLLENGIRVGTFSVGINDLQDAVRKAGGTQEQINSVGALQQLAVNASLQLAQLAKGSVSNYEQQLFQQGVFTKNDRPEVLKYKAELIRARGEFDKFIWKKYSEFEKSKRGTAEDFLDSPQYQDYIKQYDSSLEKIRSTYLK